MSITKNLSEILKAHFGKDTPPQNENELLSIIIGASVGDPVQRAKARMYRKYTAVHILSVLGFSKAVTEMAISLHKECEQYSLHHLAGSIADMLSRYSSMRDDMAQAQLYHEAALRHADIFLMELKYNWQYAQIRDSYGSPAFADNAAQYQLLAEEIGSSEIQSVRLTFIHHELLFFHAYVTEDIASAVEVCRAAVDYFENLPFDHQLAKNIFTFHLVDIYLHFDTKLAEAELIVQSALERPIHSHYQKKRFQKLLDELESRREGEVSYLVQSA